jgi:hypothetical protein
MQDILSALPISSSAILDPVEKKTFGIDIDYAALVKTFRIRSAILT